MSGPATLGELLVLQEDLFLRAVDVLGTTIIGILLLPIKGCVSWVVKEG